MGRSVAVVMPAYNEDGLPEFVSEVSSTLAGSPYGPVHFVIVDDASERTIPCAQHLSAFAESATIEVLRNPENRGHGPSVLAAYRRGLELGTDLVLHVDSDGQFAGDDIRHVLDAVGTRDGARGARIGRDEPWFRRPITKVAATLAVGRSSVDSNTPLRAYTHASLKSLLDVVPAEALVPHVRFTALEHRWRLDMAVLDVAHKQRTSEGGTGWDSGRLRCLIPRTSLVRFVVRAGCEVAGWRYRDASRLAQPLVPPVAPPASEVAA